MRSELSDLKPVTAVAVPIAVAPFGYLVGWLFTVHLLGSAVEAIWLTTVVLTSLALLAVSLRT